MNPFNVCRFQRPTPECQQEYWTESNKSSINHVKEYRSMHSTLFFYKFIFKCVSKLKMVQLIQARTQKHKPETVRALDWFNKQAQKHMKVTLI